MVEELPTPGQLRRAATCDVERLARALGVNLKEKRRFTAHAWHGRLVELVISAQRKARFHHNPGCGERRQIT